MDEQTLQVLKSIEKLLRGAMGSAGPLPPANNGGIKNLVSNAIDNRNDRNKTRTMTAMSSAMSKTSDIVLGLNTNLKGLNTEVTHTTGGFSTLRTQLSGLNKQLSGGLDTAPIAKFTDMLGKAAVGGATGGIGGGTAPQAQANSILGKAAQTFSSGFIARIRPDDIVAPLKITATRMVENFSKVGTTTAALSGIFSNLGNVVKQLTTDYLDLARVGLGSSLADMSLNALSAGMSLKEYTETLRSANNFATRVGSIADYERVTSAANAQLATLGVFGAEAKSFQASLASSNTSIGIAQGEMTDVIAAQVQAFSELRKTTNMTGDEFTKLMTNIARNEQTQKELVGLDPRLRAARLNEITQIATTGQRLGLTADASAKLTEALLAQRGDTVKGRFEGAGRIRQAAAFAGLGADGERAAQISMKGRRATADETEELRGILGRIDSAQQGIYEAGSLGAQNVIDQQTESLSATSIGKAMQAGREGNLAEQSGIAGSNKDFGKHVGTFGQAVGQFGSFLHGFQNSVGPAIIGAVGAGLLLAFRGPILKLLMSRLGGGAIEGVASGGIRGLASKAADAGVNFGQRLSSLSIDRPFQNAGARLRATGTGIRGGLTSAVQMGGNAWNATRAGASSALNGARGAVGAIKAGTAGANVAEFGQTLLTTGKTLWEGTKGIIGGLRVAVKAFGPLAGLFDAGIELFTGEISNALNPNAGIMDRIGGAVSAFFSAIPNMIIDVIGFVFGDQLGTQLQNGFDQFVAAANGSIRFLFGKVFAGWGEILAMILPDDSGLVKTLKNWGSSAGKSAQENFDTMGKLADDHSKTLSSISKENTDAANKVAASANTATITAVAAQSKFNNVSTASAVTAAQLTSDARSILASPQVQVPAIVGPANVNTPTDQPASAANDKAASNKTQSDANADVVALLTSMLAVMQQNLELGKTQAANSDAMLTLSRPRVSFASSEVQASQLIKRYST